MPSYDANVYYHPEKYGWETVGEIQWGYASYDFDITAVWKKGRKFYMESDSGCSCPSPFESTEPADLKPMTAHQVIKELNRLCDDFCGKEWARSDEESKARQDVARLHELVMA